ncbi:putative E3 ubiquitin-protein ligase MGRN1 [Morus notabilis]|uniref:Putative E3 ubiquitin-protein ligase MGRN1 n=1 Tax=Morus notabilis TaxID=981085 RepID=W9S847_9ROSA|nr:probable BOI-related E3 ubiquitin-protein ligase 3 [Morus notabilis]EXC16574.1 putative E3 ubiquitin-protein ligase MGRN1 [Morus notabilis]
MAIQAQLYQENLGFPLCGSQDWTVDIGNNGCGAFNFNQFSFGSQQKNHHHHHQDQQQIFIQELQNLQQKNDKFLHDNTLSMAYSQRIAEQAEKQRQEVDQYIKLHNESLRLMLQEQRKQLMTTLIKKIEPKLLALLRDKDEEIALAAKRTMELEDLLRKLESENQAWQRVAQEKEAMVVSLNNSLEQAREMASFCPSNGAEDAESCCDFGMENRGEEETRGGKQSVMVCKACNSRNSCVLLLPCRHLCSCKACEAFLDSCPVCRTPKKASIEALIF